MKNLEDKQKKWLRPGRAAICAQVPEDLADKIIEVARDNAVSRSTVIIDAIEQYFKEDKKEPQIIEKEVIKEVERVKTEFEIDIRDLAAEQFAAILEISKKHNLNYLKSIEMIINFLIKKAGAVEVDFVKQAINIKNK